MQNPVEGCGNVNMGTFCGKMQRCYKYPPTSLSEHKVMCTAHGPFFTRLLYVSFLVTLQTTPWYVLLAVVAKVFVKLFSETLKIMFLLHKCKSQFTFPQDFGCLNLFCYTTFWVLSISFVWKIPYHSVWRGTKKFLPLVMCLFIRTKCYSMCM